MESTSQGMMAFMPVYIPVAPYMNAPYTVPYEEACVSSPPESVPERVSDAPSDKDAAMRQTLEEISESTSWYPYQEGFWVRASSLRLLDDGRWNRTMSIAVIH